MKRRARPCVYCVEAEGTSKDHVVPDCLFVDPKPPNLLTVPACLSCNNVEKSQDDTFLRDRLVLDKDNDHPIAKTLVGTKVRRSALRNQSEMARLLAGAEQQDDEGNYRVEIPDHRTTRIMCRIVRGLYYCERKEILPKDHALKVLRQPTPLFSRLYEKLRRPRAHTYGDVFGFAWLRVPEPLRMIWLLWFYDSVVFSVSSSDVLARSE